MKFALKKKKNKQFLKPKKICILYTEKPQKEKKKWKEKKWTKVPVQLKKSYWEIWNLKLEKRHYSIGTGRRHKSYKQGGMQNIDVKV